MVKGSKKLGKKGQRNMTYRKKKYNNKQSVKKVKSGKKTSVRRSRKRGGARPTVIPKGLKKFYTDNEKIKFSKLEPPMELQIDIDIKGMPFTISKTPTPAFLSLVLLLEVLTSNTDTPYEKNVKALLNPDLINLLQEIVKPTHSKHSNGSSGGGKQKGGTFTNPIKISILGNYIALLKEFISIRRPYTFASYRIKHPRSVITGVKINDNDKNKLKFLYQKLSTGHSYVTLASLLSSLPAPRDGLATSLNELLFPSERSVQIFTQTFFKNIENLCNELDKLLFKVKKFLILPPPPIGAAPMNVEALGYAAPEVSPGYAVLPSQAQNQAVARANLARRREPRLYEEIKDYMDSTYFDVSAVGNAAGDAAGDAAGPEIQPHILDRHNSLYSADNHVTLDVEEERININQTERIQSESLTPAQAQENKIHSEFVLSLERFKSVVINQSSSAQRDFYTLLPE